MASVWGRVLGWTACVASVVLLAAALIVGARAAAEVRVTGAVVRLAAVAGRPAAGYLTVHAGPASLALVGATTPLAERIEFHGSSTAAGVIRMTALPMVRIAAERSGGFAPGGAHLMIFGLRRDVKPGDRVPITLQLRGGTTIRVDAAAVAAGAAISDDTPAGHGAH